MTQRFINQVKGHKMCSFLNFEIKNMEHGYPEKN